MYAQILALNWIRLHKPLQLQGVMGYIWAINYLYLLTYYFRFRSGTRVPVVLPGGYRVINYPDTAAVISSELNELQENNFGHWHHVHVGKLQQNLKINRVFNSETLHNANEE